MPNEEGSGDVGAEGPGDGDTGDGAGGAAAANDGGGAAGAEGSRLRQPESARSPSGSRRGSTKPAADGPGGADSSCARRWAGMRPDTLGYPPFPFGGGGSGANPGGSVGNSGAGGWVKGSTAAGGPKSSSSEGSGSRG